MNETTTDSPGFFGGLLNFAGSPAGQGLLSAAFSGMAGARRGQPWNNFGRAGVAGLLGYQNAQDQLTQDKRAATAQQGITEQGDVLPGLHILLAARAMRCRHQQIVSLSILDIPTEISVTFPLPATLHHDRQTVNDHIQETAHQQAQQHATALHGREQETGLQQGELQLRLQDRQGRRQFPHLQGRHRTGGNDQPRL